MIGEKGTTWFMSVTERKKQHLLTRKTDAVRTVQHATELRDLQKSCMTDHAEQYKTAEQRNRAREGSEIFTETLKKKKIPNHTSRWMRVREAIDWLFT